jgi:hypothetical protein
VKRGWPRLAIMQAVIPGRERTTRPGSAPMPGFGPAAPRDVPGPSTRSASESTCAPELPLVRLPRSGQYGPVGDRWCTSD